MWGLLFGFCVAFSLCAAYSVKPEPTRCRPDEVLACVHPCPPERTCRTRDIQFSCLIKGKCEQKCICKEGYFRNPLGDCITGKECDLCPGKNEFFSCGPQCDNVCSELHTQNRTNCPIVNIQCNRKCYCEDGFARDDKNACVPVENCSKRKCQNKRETEKEVPEPLRCYHKNEETACVHPCPPERTCRNRDIRFSCFIEGKCEEKCVCKDGFYRNPLGDCITGEECDMCSGKNEFFACGTICDNECSELNTQNRTNCPLVNVICNRKCYCEDGFARDHQKECVPVEKCPKLPIAEKQEQINYLPLVANDAEHSTAEPECGQNEEYTACKRSCPPETCISLVAHFKCAGNEPCKPRCTCKSGFLRLMNGSPCIRQEECPKRQTDDNAQEIQ